MKKYQSLSHTRWGCTARSVIDFIGDGAAEVVEAADLDRNAADATAAEMRAAAM